jgi:hypothetical protein
MTSRGVLLGLLCLVAPLLPAQNTVGRQPDRKVDRDLRGGGAECYRYRH